METRQKLCDNLDMLIECPVCKRTLSGHVYQCESGHNVCGECTQKKFPCVQCKKPYTSIRNNLAELLSSQADMIKEIIMGFADESANVISQMDRETMVTEGDFNDSPLNVNARAVIEEKKEEKSSIESTSTSESRPIFKPDSNIYEEIVEHLKKSLSLKSEENSIGPVSPVDEKQEEKPDIESSGLTEQFPCWIDRSCSFSGTFIEIVEHLRKSHPLEFEQHSTGTLPHTQKWQMNYSGANCGVKNYRNRAFLISSGLFLLHILTNENGEMRACVLMYAGSRTARQHSYKIEIECDGTKVAFIGQVQCSRVYKNYLSTEKKGIFISRNDALFKTLCDKKRFTCTVMIEKKGDTTNDEVPTIKSRQNNVKTHQTKSQNRHQQNKKSTTKNNSREKKNHTNNPSMTSKMSGSMPQLNQIHDNFPRPQQQIPQSFLPNVNHQLLTMRPPPPPLMMQPPLHPGQQQYSLYPNLQPQFIPPECVQPQQPTMMMNNSVNANIPYNFSHTNNNSMQKPGEMSSDRWMNPNVKSEHYKLTGETAISSAPLEEKRRAINQYEKHSRHQSRKQSNDQDGGSSGNGRGRSRKRHDNRRMSPDDDRNDKRNDCVVS